MDGKICNFYMILNYLFNNIGIRYLRYLDCINIESICFYLLSKDRGGDYE